MEKKVTGIGGIFFKCKDPAAMNEWYQKHLGIPVTAYGATFNWRDEQNPEKTGSTAWSTFPADTAYFAPSQKDFMINYRVHDLELLVSELQREGIKFTDEIQTYEYGKFVHLLDPEGNAIELWEPVD
ncbi:VOC family protein [Pedobacter sp. SYP-B3415]|uniref:VOC family protein n=1 Tax=Pedobacter sp. SYP-B3415 TaxID=2496641 RepID=UPI00101BAB87|nr:VOC family protein [Pedobacter sp. SYP-B3415]